MHQHHQPLLRRALLAVALLGLSACESTPGPTVSSSTSAAGTPSVKISQEVSTTAQVIAVDQASRLVTLRGEDDRLRRVRAAPAVHNLDQISAGDTLRVRYEIVLMATQLPAGADLRLAQGAVAAARAAKGAAPAGAFEAAVSVRVRIESIDAAHDLVVFAPASGELITHRIATDAGREFVRKLKIGDLVQLDYGEALGLSIEKAAK